MTDQRYSYLAQVIGRHNNPHLHLQGALCSMLWSSPVPQWLMKGAGLGRWLQARPVYIVAIGTISKVG